MSRRIAQFFDPVAGGGQDLVRLRRHQDGADGHLAALSGGLGFGQGQGHEGDEGRVHGAQRGAAAGPRQVAAPAPLSAFGGGPTLRSMETPVIGITVDSEPPGGYSGLPWYALRENYAEAVGRAGGLPVMLPHITDLAESYLDTISGLVIAGGDFDVDPALFGAAERHASVRTKDARTAFELAITRAALARDMPILGICGGQQLLHVALGGTLIQHIPDAVEGALEHEQPNPRTEAGHEVRVEEGTLLHRIVGVANLAVNSAHHQAAADAPVGVVINARAPDGVIEGIEAPSRRFCLGVQWHPEYAISAGDGRIFAAFVEACRGGG